VTARNGLTALALAGAAAVACAGGAPAPDRLDQLFAGDLRVVDLTYPVAGNIPYWPSPTGRPFSHDTLARHASGAPSMAAYRTSEHYGTHLDAPIHFADGQPSVDLLTAQDLFGPAVVVDVSAEAAAHPDYALTREDLAAWEAEYGPIPQRAIVLLRTGWGVRWSDSVAYRNADARGVMHFPGFGEDAARFLVTQRDIRGIGIDNLSVDPGAADGFPAHLVVNGAGRFHLENVANLDQLPPTGVYLLVAPIKIAGGSGGQVRLFAVLAEP